eukprot:GHVR01121662.1.p1 GENE.GHVR01121662.1~~GHVR01121662.1.p1  ORF type:complete len:177 (-),score=45.33 GHVR01121662.1:42-572(-)
MGASSVLAPKVGPLGMSPKKVGDDIMKATQSYKGLKVTVKLTVINRQAAVEIVPNATTLLIKALKEPIRDRKKVKNIKHSGNLSKEVIFDVARVMRSKSISKFFKGTVKEVLGTASVVCVCVCVCMLLLFFKGTVKEVLGTASVYLFLFIYLHIYIHLYTYIYLHIYILFFFSVEL